MRLTPIVGIRLSPLAVELQQTLALCQVPTPIPTTLAEAVEKLLNGDAAPAALATGTPRG
jgi:hypothetical protein